MDKEHNTKTEAELYADQQFMRGFGELKVLRSSMAGTKGDMNAVYKRLKDLGFSKEDVEFAMTLEDKDVGQVIAGFESKIRIARLFGHRLGRQLSLLDADRTPQDDRAYEEGRAAGMLRKTDANPYQPGSPEHGRWQAGNNDGHSFINKDLKAAMAANEPGN